jgi:serine/threonine-protein kinase
MTLTSGTRLGPYEILSAIGAGGMGEVYRAADPRLGREVAVKVVSGRLFDNPRALARLQTEARTVASLSHPNIVALHDIGTDQGVTFVVMELLDGEPLDRCVGTAPSPWTKALEIAASVADALAAAHEKGVIHRDLKPPNIFVTRDGRVKVLDFGLAKQDLLLPDKHTGATGLEQTEPGVVLGTVGYMSPEQVKGEPADARSDIFSLGCVLYEMLSGRRAFRGGTSPEVLAAILRDQPRLLAECDSQVPAQVSAVVQRCLEKDPEQRFQSARDLAFSLRHLLSAPETRVSSEANGLSRFRSVSARRRIVALATGCLVITTGVLWFNWQQGAPANTSRIQSLAVLPLSNLSPDPGQEYFADAMTEELTTRLAKMGNWRITSRTSVMGYRGTQKKTPEIAKELGVDAIIEGSIIREASRVKVSAQLIDGRSDRHIWADVYEREMEGVLAIQDDVARAIAREVGLTLTPDTRRRLAAATRPVLPAAYDAYVRGRHAWDKRSEADLREAIRFFQESIDADPTYAPAYAGLADAYGQLGDGSYVSPEGSFPRARAAALRALELDPALPEAHAALGYTSMYYEWDFAKAEAEYKRAIELNPNYAVAHQWYAYLLTALERPASEPEREIAIARKLDPLSVPINIDYAYILHYYQRNDEALRAVQLALEMNPKYSPGYFWLGRIYTSEHRYKEADSALKNIGTLRTWTPAMAVLGYLYAKSERADDAKAILAEFDALARAGRYASGYAIAVIYAGLGDRERTLSALEAAYRERSHWLVWLKRDPRWDEIREQPRFRELVRRVGLPSLASSLTIEPSVNGTGRHATANANHP